VKPAAVLRPPGSPAEDLGPAGGAAGIAEHAAREGVWLAIEPINRFEDYMTNRLEQAVGLGEEIERQVGLDSAWVCALTCSTGTWRGTTWPRRSLTPGGGSPACMSMTTRRRPYREVGQFGQVVGVVSPQPSTGARSTGGDIRNDKLQRRYEATSTIASILDWLGATPDRTDRDPRNHAP
jgi:hypothetical protein